MQRSRLETGLPHFSCLIWFLTSLCVSCASQGPPSGGPPDRTPPEVVLTRPSSDATKIPPDHLILIQFSEQMDRRSVEESFFFSPAAREGVKFRWQGERMEAEPVGGLRPGRTYLVSVGAGSRDEMGNPMSASYDFAFSTGERIARGEIRGRVHTLDRGRSQVYVISYDLTVRPDPDPENDSPDYTTQAGSDGTFRFPRLSSGRYRTFAFEDRDRDRAYSPGVDPFSIAPADASLGDSGTVAHLGGFRSTLHPSKKIRLISSKAIDRTHVVLRFNRPVTSRMNVIISGEKDSLGILAIHLDPGDSSRALLLTQVQSPGALYRIESMTASQGVSTVTLPDETRTFKGRKKPDRSPPTVAALRPKTGAQNVPLNQVIEITFSEPMRTADVSPLWIPSDTTDVPPGVFDWSSPDRLTFTPGASWAATRSYHFSGDGDKLLDGAGNRLSSNILLSFTTVDSGRLGNIAGQISGPRDVPGSLHLIAVLVEENNVGGTTTLSQPGNYVIPELPPGSYTIIGFLDKNGDGTWTAGVPNPFLPSEPFGILSEPIAVRPRWTTEGADLSVETVRYGEGTDLEKESERP